jgi:hypothetical protein
MALGGSFRARRRVLAACSRIGDGAKLDGGFMDLPSANDEANKLEVNAAVCSLPDRKTN